MLIKGKRIGFEFKFADAPKITKSMQTAYSDLKLTKLYVIYPGGRSYLLEKNIEVINLTDYLQSVISHG